MSMGDPLPHRVPISQCQAATKAYMDAQHNDVMLERIIHPKITNIAVEVSVYGASQELVGTVTPAELIKYIRERELIEQNQTVRTLWDRYQVAVRLVGSEDNGSAD